jgi:hypothetical protein
MNNTEKRHPRTLTEAFGPYTSNYIYDPSEPPYDWQDVVVGAACAVVVVCILAILVVYP